MDIKNIFKTVDKLLIICVNNMNKMFLWIMWHIEVDLVGLFWQLLIINSLIYLNLRENKI